MSRNCDCIFVVGVEHWVLLGRRVNKTADSEITLFKSYLKMAVWFECLGRGDGVFAWDRALLLDSISKLTPLQRHYSEALISLYCTF
jgi:hypothetical protein